MNLVLDTNVLVASVSKKSPTRWLWDSFLREEYTISISTEILLEYEEIIARMMGQEVSSTILQWRKCGQRKSYHQIFPLGINQG